MIISTGSRSLDGLLGGGIRSGMVTDFFGGSGTGKSQLCFTICVNCAKEINPGESILFIDTTGNFRPERIQEISKGQGKEDVLSKISYIRVFNSSDQNNVICGASERMPRIIIVDNVTYLISNEFDGARKYLRIMKHMHSLCLTAITLDCAVVVTNMLTYSSNGGSAGESLASSISLCAHVRARLEIADFRKLLYKATLLHPAISKSCFFGIRKIGITDA
jgi:DNA repair protein RAD51